MTNEKDRTLALDIVSGCSNWFDIEHYIVPRIEKMITTIRKEEREAAFKSGRQALAAELLGHLDRMTSTTAAFHLVKNLCKIELGQEPDSLGVKVG